MARNGIKPPVGKKEVGSGRIKLSHQLVEAGKGSTDHLPAVLSFQYFDGAHECPSIWQGDEMKRLFNSFRLASTTSWREIKASGGQGKYATGLRYKPVDVPMSLPAYFSPDVEVVELAASQRARFFGVREDAIFYLIWLDKDHQVFPE